VASGAVTPKEVESRVAELASTDPGTSSLSNSKSGKCGPISACADRPETEDGP
jgi:hypothetical protein